MNTVNRRVNACCLTATQQCLTISWREQVHFQRNDGDVRFVLDQHA